MLRGEFELLSSYVRLGLNDRTQMIYRTVAMFKWSSPDMGGSFIFDYLPPEAAAMMKPGSRYIIEIKEAD